MQNASLYFCRLLLLMLLCGISFTLLSNNQSENSTENPWPEIRKERLKTLLPYAMKEAGIDAWLIICRENNNDPLAKHVGCENAGKTAVFLFYFDNTANKNKDGSIPLRSLAFSPNGEAKALQDQNFLDKVIAVPRDKNVLLLTKKFIAEQDFNSIAVNYSSTNAQADGLSYTQYKSLTSSLGPKYTKRLVSSDELVYQYLAVKLPAEVEIMRKAAKLTAQWQIEAYQQIIPGVTSDADVAKYLKHKMQQHGVTDAWAPEQNPNVVSGTDRGHSHATNRIIEYGDVIQTDFGIRVYDTWVTDIQRFAYVLKPGESEAPKDIAYYWESAKKGREAAFSAMTPGATGLDVDKAQRKAMRDNNSLPVMWNTGHPVGYVAHDSGPSLGGAEKKPDPRFMRKLKPNMTFAFDGFHSWIMPNGLPKTISVEEMVVITNEGAEYLIPPQQELVLIRPK